MLCENFSALASAKEKEEIGIFVESYTTPATT